MKAAIIGAVFSSSIFVLPCLANATSVTSGVSKVGTAWSQDAVCVYLDSGYIAKVNLGTYKGRAELSIALMSKALGKPVRIVFDDLAPLEGGCNTGTTIKPHGILVMQQ